MSIITQQKAVKTFFLIQSIYCVLVIGCVLFLIFISETNFEGGSFHRYFSIVYILLYLPFGFYIEPLLSGLIFQIIFKLHLRTIFILTAIKAIVGSLVGLTYFIIADSTNDYIESALYLFTPGLIVALYFMIVCILVYSIQSLILKLNNRKMN